MVGPDQLELNLIYKRIKKKIEFIQIGIEDLQDFLLEIVPLLDFVESIKGNICDWKVMRENIIALMITISDIPETDLRTAITTVFLQSLYHMPLIELVVSDPYFAQVFEKEGEIRNEFGAMRYVQEELKKW